MKTEIETFLPLFEGFYGAGILEYDDDELEDDELEGIDYEARSQAAAKAAVKFIEEEMEDIISGMKFHYQRVVSPRFYNYTNDSIVIMVEISTEQQDEIMKYLQLYNAEFAVYLKDRYSSHSGFISSHSNETKEWEKNLYLIEEHGHYLGAILDFILINEEVETDDMDWVCREAILNM